MAIETKWIRLYNDPFGTVNYEFVLEDVSFSGRVVRVELYNERHGDAAIMEDCDYKLYINGSVVDEDVGSPKGFGHGNTFTLSGQASAGDSWRYEFYSPYWHSKATNIDDWGGYLEFSGEVPEVEASVSGASVSPSPPIVEDIKRDGIDVTYTVSNRSPFNTVYMDLSSYGPGGEITTEEVEVNVSSGGSGDASVDIGTIYDNNTGYKWSEGSYSFCLGDTCANVDVKEGSSVIDFDGIYTKPEVPHEGDDWSVAIDLSNRTGRDISNVDVSIEVAGKDSIATGSINVSVNAGETKTVEVPKEEIKSILGINKITRGDYTVCLS